MRDKRRALGRALANALDDNGTKVDNEIAFVRKLADLDPVHIRVLKIMSRRPKHLDPIAEQMNAADEPKAVRQWHEWSIVHTDPGLEGAAYGALQVLERHGLIWDRGETPVPLPTACSTSMRSRPMATTSSTGWPSPPDLPDSGQDSLPLTAEGHNLRRRADGFIRAAG